MSLYDDVKDVGGVLDRESIANRIINSTHAMCHLGKLFIITQRNAALANNAYIYNEIRVPTGYELHLKELQSWVDTGPFALDLIEAPTLTTGVTSLTPVCTKRSSDEVIHTVFKSNPTSISGGTTLKSTYFGGVSGLAGTSEHGITLEETEFILKENTVYLLQAQNLSGGAAFISTTLEFYEIKEE